MLRNKLRKIINREFKKINESNYLLQNELDEVLEILQRIVYEIGYREVENISDMPKYYCYGNMEAFRPMWGYKRGPEELQKVFLDLPKWLEGTEFSTETMEHYELELFIDDILTLFPGSKRSGQIIEIYPGNWRNYKLQDGKRELNLFRFNKMIDMF